MGVAGPFCTSPGCWPARRTTISSCTRRPSPFQGEPAQDDSSTGGFSTAWHEMRSSAHGKRLPGDDVRVLPVVDHARSAPASPCSAWPAERGGDDRRRYVRASGDRQRHRPPSARLAGTGGVGTAFRARAGNSGGARDGRVRRLCGTRGRCRRSRGPVGKRHCASPRSRSPPTRRSAPSWSRGGTRRSRRWRVRSRRSGPGDELGGGDRRCRMARRGRARGGFDSAAPAARVFLGSRASRIIRHSPVPVIVVPAVSRGSGTVRPR